MAIDIVDSFSLGTGRILGESIEDNIVFSYVCILLLEGDSLHAALEDLGDVIFADNIIELDNDAGAFEACHLTGVRIDEILDRSHSDTTGDLTTDSSLEIFLCNLNLLCEVEDLVDRHISFKTDGTQESSHREFLLAVDISIHDIIDVSSELNPATTEGDDTSGIELRTISVNTITEENAGRTVELRDNDTFGTIDDERTLVGHIRDRTEINILNSCVEILVIGVCAREFKFSLQRHKIGKTSLQAFINRISWGVNIIVKELEFEAVAGVFDGEIFCKHLIQALVLALFGRRVKLQEIAERLKLNFKEVRERERILDRREINTRLIGFY